ncbi:MAG TPA: HutD family protein [Casimicrobiaceae bacterium]
MAKITHLTNADYVRQAWRNGGGTTTELARNGATDRWLWRLSVADVDRSGPFSDFTGYRRFIMLLEGSGMALSFDCVPPVVLDRRYRPFSFDGGMRTQCTLLDGPIRDMNLIVDDGQVEASLDVRLLEREAPWPIEPSEYVLLHAIEGRFEVAIDAHRVALAPGDTLRIDCSAASTISAVTLDASAVLAHAAIEHRR